MNMDLNSLSDDAIMDLYSKILAKEQKLKKELFILGQKLKIDETEMQNLKSKILDLDEQQRIMVDINKNLKKRGI
jgi:cell division protein FtsL